MSLMHKISLSKLFIVSMLKSFYQYEVWKYTDHRKSKYTLIIQNIYQILLVIFNWKKKHLKHLHISYKSDKYNVYSN